jgi:hypothetical protein
MSTQTQPGNKHTPQNILNWSFDSDFNLLAVGLIGYDGSTTRRIKVDTNGNLVTTLPTNAATSDNQTNGTQKTQNTEDTLLLRRIVKLLESQATVDINNRQRIAIDSTTNSTTYNGGLATSAGGSLITAGVPTVGTTYPFYTWEGPVDQRWRVMEDSHVSYQLGIRSRLVFT